MALGSDGPIRVMLVEPHGVVLAGLRRILEDEKPGLVVVGTAADCASAALLANKIKPDVVVLGSGVSLEDKYRLVQALINGRDTRVLLMSDPHHGKEHEAAILRGACGLVQREDTPDILIKAIKKVYEGQLWLDRSTMGRLFLEFAGQKGLVARDSSRNRIESLTGREQEVVRTLVANPGAANKLLANKLHIGEHTLRNHLSRIYDKLGVPNRMELYAWALRHDLAAPAAGSTTGPLASPGTLGRC